MENKGLLFIRKFIATAMIVILVLTCAPLGLVPEELTLTSSAAATELKSGLYTYELENGKAVITDVDQTISGDITIPSKLGGYDVVRLDYSAFSRCTAMTSVIIPSTVEVIEDTVFSGCENLKSISIPGSVKTIGYKAFGNTKIESITIPASVTDLDSSAFSGCAMLKSINVDPANSKYTSVSGVVFDKDKSTLISFPAGSDMISYTIPSSVTRVADYAFYCAEKLNSITFSENLVTIGYYSFAYCELLRTATIPESVKIIGESAFYGCEGLVEVKLPSALTSIEAYSFGGCSKLQKINIPTTVKSIGASAFRYCEKLAFTLHDGIEYIGDGAFYDTYNYNNAANFDKGVFYCGKYLLEVSSDFYTESYTVKNGTVLIAEYAFYNEDALKKVEIPSTVEIIGDYAFAECESLSTINYPDSLKYIGDSTLYNTAFYKNTANWKDNILYAGKHLISYKNNNNTAYTIKAGTKTIADDAITESKFTTLTIPASLENIAGYPFDGCYSLEKVIVQSGNKSFTAIDGVLFTKNKSKLILYPVKKVNTDYVVPSGVKVIGERAFSSTYNLESIRLADTVERIEEEAFIYSDAITYVLPKSLKYIGRNVIRYYTVNVGYLGSEAQWNKVAIYPENINLAYAKVIFNYVPHTHTYTSKVTKEPTCKDSGLRTFTCSCGANYSTYIFDSSAHKLDSGKVTKKATYKKAGKKIYVCTICGETVKEEKIPKLTVAKVKSLKAKSIKVESSSSFTLSWGKVTGADKYEVYRQSGKKWKKIGTTTKNSLTVKKLKAGSTYKFKVRAIRTKDKINGAYSDVFSVKIVPSKPSLSLKAGKKQLTASWKKLTGVTGFEVQSSTSKKFTKKTSKTTTVKKAAATSVAVKKLSKGKKYYVRVRAYKTVSGKKIYGNWSSIKNVKVK